MSDSFIRISLVREYVNIFFIFVFQLCNKATGDSKKARKHRPQRPLGDVAAVETAVQKIKKEI